MRVTTKGQVTIPIEIRERLGIEAGTEVEFELAGDEAHLRVARRRGPYGWELVDALRGKAGRGPSTDEILELTRGDD